jgi:hypothetical protein
VQQRTSSAWSCENSDVVFALVKPEMMHDVFLMKWCCEMSYGGAPMGQDIAA